MRSPAISLKIKRLRRRLGVGAPRHVVRRHTHWSVFFVALLISFCLGCGLAWVVQAGVWSEVDSQADLRMLLTQQQEELKSLRLSVATGQSVVSMERATQQQLLAKIHDLESENTSLKEEMLVFERLVPADGAEQGVRVENFNITSVAGRYRYRLLFAFQAGQRAEIFRGRFQVVVRYRVEGREQELLLPTSAADAQIEVRNFLRKEGRFDLSPAITPDSIQVRVFQGDTLRTQRDARF